MMSGTVFPVVVKIKFDKAENNNIGDANLLKTLIQEINMVLEDYDFIFTENIYDIKITSLEIGIK